MHMYTDRREQERENTGWKIPMENQSQHTPVISAWEEEGGGSKAPGQPGRQLKNSIRRKNSCGCGAVWTLEDLCENQLEKPGNVGYMAKGQQLE